MGRLCSSCHIFAIFFCALGSFFLGGSRTLDLIKMSFILVCLQNAVSGGSLKTSAKYGSVFTIALQCLACILGIAGSLGSNFRAKTGRLFSFFLMAFFVGKKGLGYNKNVPGLANKTTHQPDRSENLAGN